MASTPRTDCGHENPDDTDGCSSSDAGVTDRQVSANEYPAVPSNRPPGIVAVDLSAFSRSEGLFVANKGAKAGARYALDTDIVAMGRDPGSDIFLDDITVSFRHAEVRRSNDRYWIHDVGSLNGTYVNRELIEQRELVEGDEVQIGKFKLVFVHGTSSQ